MGLTVERTISVKESENEVAQSCLTLYDPTDCSPRNFPGKSTGVGLITIPTGPLIGSQARD